MSREESQAELAAYEAQENARWYARSATEPLLKQVEALQAALLRQAKDIKALQAAVAKLKAKKSPKSKWSGVNGKMTGGIV